MTKDELALMLRNAFTREGEWNFDAVADYDAEFWREWIAARLRGKDPWIPYERDEYPYTAYGLFLDYEQDARRAGISTAPCREGAAKFLESLDWLPSTEEPCHVLRNALILVGKLRAWAQESLDTLRALITDETLLKHGDDWRLELHRSALFALAAIQKRGDDTDHDLWMEWLEPWKDAVEAHKYDFIPAAFSGLAMSEAHVPVTELKSVLATYQAARAAGHKMKLTPAILALWIDRERQSEDVRRELWDAVGADREQWDIICVCADRAWPEILNHAEMKAIYPVGTPVASEPVQSRHDLWGADVTFPSPIAA